MARKAVKILEEIDEEVVADRVLEGVHAQPPSVGVPLPGASNPFLRTPASDSAFNTGVQPLHQTLEQLLEHQWELGSQFLMEQGRHLDVAQLLSCLYQLKQDNHALEEHVQRLVQRKNQLTEINAHLSIPLERLSALELLGSTPSQYISPQPPGDGPRNHTVGNLSVSHQQHDHPYSMNPDTAGRSRKLTHSTQSGHQHVQFDQSSESLPGSQKANGPQNGSAGVPAVPVAASLLSTRSHSSAHPLYHNGAESVPWEFLN